MGYCGRGAEVCVGDVYFRLFVDQQWIFRNVNMKNGSEVCGNGEKE